MRQWVNSRKLLATAIGLSLALAGTMAMRPATADTDPPAGTPATMTADALPTWQINGVVWSAVTVGDTVYATGSFSKARPPGTNEGDAAEVDRGNLVAINIKTGALITTFDHSLNGQGLRIAATPDGSRVFVGGEFTTVDGVARNHIAAFDTATGALDPNFAPDVSGVVKGIAATNTTVYLGGNFFSIVDPVNPDARTRLAAVTIATGAPLAWAPTADDDEVTTLAVSPDGTRVIVGGKFQSLNGATKVGVGAVDATTGATRPWSSTPTPARTASQWSYPTDFKVQGDVLYSSDEGNGGHWFDGRWAANINTGDLIWLDNCYGASYGIFPHNDVVYSVGHAHDCTSLGAFPETSPQTWQRALAETSVATGTDKGEPSNNSSYSGQPTPSLLQWFPLISIGTITGQNQGAWTITGNDDYLVLGGEFPRINGVKQQGLVRFTTKAKAANKSGPVFVPAAPVVSALPAGRVSIRWQSSWDRDNNKLRYEVLRDDETTPIGSVSGPSSFWSLPTLGFTDEGLAVGTSHTYKIRVIDVFGNQVTTDASAAVVAQGGTLSSYAAGVISDGAADYWRLGEASGTTSYDWAGGNHLTTSSGVSRNVTGAISGDLDKASGFSGTSSGSARSGLTPAPSDFTLEAWVKTGSSLGGKIIGLGNKTSGLSSSYDRHLYMTNGGKIVFGVYPGVVKTLQSPAAYNNNTWHHVVGTLSAATGMRLYVDGALVGSDATTTSSQPYTGYWRIGGDNLSGWPSAPASSYLNGSIDEAAVYSLALSAAKVSGHFGVGSGTVVPNQLPVAAFTSTCTFLDCTLNAGGTTDPDGTIASYAWDFGDGTTGTGATPAHSYATAGDHTVQLTVTDNSGGTDTVIHTVTTVAGTIASDSFARTAVNGLGTADLGGAWTSTGTAANLSVDGNTAKAALPTLSAGPGGYLNTLSTDDAEVTTSVAADKVGTGNGAYFWLAGRRIAGAGEYRARIRLRPSGVVSLQLSRTDAANAETAIGTELTVAGLTYAPGTVLKVKVLATGTAPTTLKAKVWAADAAEPDWQVTGTDTTAALQAVGSVGFRTYLSGSSTNAPIVLTIDDFVAVRTHP